MQQLYNEFQKRNLYIRQTIEEEKINRGLWVQKNSYNKFTTIYMIKAIENVKISSGNTTTIVNGQRKEFAKKVSLLNDVTD